jgi:hypothetical protein
MWGGVQQNDVHSNFYKNPLVGSKFIIKEYVKLQKHILGSDIPPTAAIHRTVRCYIPDDRTVT